MEVASLLVICNDSLLRSIECKSFTLSSRTNLCNIIKSEHHILRRHRDRSSIGWIKDIVALKHQDLCLKNSLIAQWEMDSHLVTVEVGIERRTCQRMELDSLTFDKLRLECLDTKSVKRRGTVQEYRMSLHNILKNIPNYRLTTVYNLLCALNSLHYSALNKLTDNKRLVKFCCHKLWQTALTHLQLRTNDNNRTCRIVNTLTEKILTETSSLTLQRVRQRLQRAIRFALYSTALS